MTLACSNVFESDLVCLAYEFEKPSPNPKPSASAIGGDLKITVNKSSRKKTSLESIRASIRIASQACLTTRLVGLMGLIGLIKTCGSYRSHKSYKSYSCLISFRLGFKRELLVRVPQLIPGDALFAVGRFAPEDGHERAFDAALGVVAVFVFALALAEHAVDEGQRFLVIGLVVVVVVFVDERRLGVSATSGAFDAGASEAVLAREDGRERAICAADRLRHVAAHAVDLHAGVVEQDLVRVLVNQVEVVEDVADIFAPELAAAAVGLDRARVQHPTDHVHVVDVLFDDVVARKPGEVVPVADLPVEFRLHLFAFFPPPQVALIPG